MLNTLTSAKNRCHTHLKGEILITKRNRNAQQSREEFSLLILRSTVDLPTPYLYIEELTDDIEQENSK